MNRSLFTAAVLAAFVLLAGFGLLMPSGNHGGHETDCPFASGISIVCSAPLLHLEHWQSAFTIILVKTLLFATIVLVFFTLLRPILKTDPQYRRYRLRARTPLRPPLFQELFARGVLNPKVP